MKNIFIIAIAAIVLVGCNTQTNQDVVSLSDANLFGNEAIITNFGQIDLEHNYITDESSEKLYDEMDLQRASQAYLWSLPMVAFKVWQIEQDKAYGADKLGTIVILDTYQEKKGIVTGNLVTPYILSFFNLKDGPVVIEYPEGNTAAGILDTWQKQAIALGPGSEDKGKGGKYIIVGPEDDISKYQKEGYYTKQNSSNIALLALRFIDPDPKIAEKFKDEIKMGRLGKEVNKCTFIEGLDKEWSSTPYRGIAYWETLNELLNTEPVKECDKYWMAMLEPLGIVKGQEFKPTERQKEILIKGAALGELMARNIQTNPRFVEPYWENTTWEKCFHFPYEQEDMIKVYLDERVNWFYEAVTASQKMVNPQVGLGQAYMTTKRDSEGRLLRADKTYKLTVPANVPVKQFWSVTLYSENTRSPYDNGEGTLKSANIGSRDEGLNYNSDGSIDLYIGAKAPEGYESNYMKTVGEDGWFVYFRLYAPTEPFFDKTFSLPDFVMID